jgi:class 3 adenylate cyclase
MSETRKLAATLVADVVGYSRLAGADEDRTLSRLRGLRSDLIDPAIAAHRGRGLRADGRRRAGCCQEEDGGRRPAGCAARPAWDEPKRTPH